MTTALKLNGSFLTVLYQNKGSVPFIIEARSKQYIGKTA